MWIRRGGIVLFLSLALFGAPEAAAKPVEGDVQAVYCLATAHRAQLADAAVHLDLAKQVPGTVDKLSVGARTYTVEEWRTQAPAHFTRTCKTLIATVPQLASAQQGDSLPPLVTLLVPLFAGSLLTLWVQRLQVKADRRVVEADVLRATLNGFTQAARDYVGAWIENPDASYETVEPRRFQLEAELRAFLHFRRYRARVKALIGALPVEDRLGVVYRDHSGYRSKNRPERERLGREQLRRIAQTVADVELLIHDHRFGAAPWFVRRNMRRSLDPPCAAAEGVQS